MTASAVRVLLVDDHPVVRAGLRAMFSAQPNLIVVGEASSAAEAVRACELLRPDVVLMDLQLGDGDDGVSATRSIVELGLPTHVLILTTYDTDLDIARSIDAGAIGYMLKDAQPERLYQAVLAVAMGETVFAAQSQIVFCAPCEEDRLGPR